MSPLNYSRDNQCDNVYKKCGISNLDDTPSKIEIEEIEILDFKNKQINFVLEKLKRYKNYREFFLSILKIFNYKVKSAFINITRNLKKRQKSNAHLKFLLQCRSHDVFPKHIKKSFNLSNSKNFHSNFVNRKVKQLYKNYCKKILNLEITDHNTNIRFLSKKIQNDTEIL